jgi:phosphoribosylformylglycinamidine cyclo-ligase
MKKAITYTDAGVDIKETDNFVESISGAVKSTQSREVINNNNGFASLYDLDQYKSMDHPVMLTSTDGIGTKLKLLLQLGCYQSIGHDLVSMVVNDIAVHGGRPLVFLDYIASSKFEPFIYKQIITGISDACIECNCSLVGGETAIMPNVYDNGNMDVAGFAVGIADKKNLLPTNIKKGDYIQGIESSGLHANGFSLVNKLLKETTLQVSHLMLAPTLNYVKICSNLVERNNIKAFVHITGGGFANIKRVLPEGLSYSLEDWIFPEVFRTIQYCAGLNKEEMKQIFNCGYGMLMITEKPICEDMYKIIGRVV